MIPRILSRLQVVRRLASRGTRLARDHWGLLVVLMIALIDRVVLFRWWKAFPGGDTYNFILIAQELLKGSYPVAEKRLPFYPALIALAHLLGLNWESAALLIALLFSLVALVLFYALARELGLSKTAALVALFPFEVVAPFLFQSIRGYADTTFVALSLGALVALLGHPSWRRAVMMGVLLAATSLTRPEGWFFTPAVLGVSALRWRNWRPTLTAALVTLAGIAPFVFLSWNVGRPLVPREYLADASQTEFGVPDVRTFAANYEATWRSIGIDRLWGEPLRLFRDASRTSVANLPARLWSFLSDPKEAPAILMLLGFGFLLLRRTSVFLRVLVPFLALAIPIAWWGVRQRFLIVLYPLAFLLLAAGAEVFLRGVRRLATPWNAAGLGTVIASLGLFVLAGASWRAHNIAETREVNVKNWGRDYAFYEALQAARELPGVIAFAHRSSIVLALFGERDAGRAVFSETHLDAPTGAEQWNVFQRYDVRYVVARNGADGFLVLSDPKFRDRFQVVREFAQPQRRGSPDRATIYAVRKEAEKEPLGRPNGSGLHTQALHRNERVPSGNSVKGVGAHSTSI